MRRLLPELAPGGERGRGPPRGARPGPRSAPASAGGYQLDLAMPGSSPLCAISRKQMRHRPNFRNTARGRPQREQRVYPRTANFGFRFALAISAFLAIPAPSGFLEGEPEPLEQAAPLLVGGRGRDDRDVHPALAVDLVRVDLVEHDLLGQAEGVVALPVELLRGKAPEVADPRQRQGEQPVEELPHPVVAQRHAGADRLALAQLEL